MAEEYPSLDVRMNRELSRLLVYLDQGEVLPRFIEALADDDSEVMERLHLATQLRYLKSGWAIDDKLALLEYFDASKSLPEDTAFRGTWKRSPAIS